MHRFQKHFSVEEAHALLPELRRIFKEIHHTRRKLTRCDEDLGKQILATGGDIGGKATADLLRYLARMNTLLHEIREMGLVVKDVDRGLVDFPHLRDGHEVFLCWELEEDDIEFWHDLDDGYSGRERL